MVDYYSFYKLAQESSNTYTEKISFFIIIFGLSLIFILPTVLWGLDKMGMLFSAKQETKANIFMVIFAIAGVIIFIYGMFHLKQIENYNLLADKKKELNVNISNGELIETGKKLKKFCENYFSKNDKEFCKDQKLNQYTYNVYFEAKYKGLPFIDEDIKKDYPHLKIENIRDDFYTVGKEIQELLSVQFVNKLIRLVESDDFEYIEMEVKE